MEQYNGIGFSYTYILQINSDYKMKQIHYDDHWIWNIDCLCWKYWCKCAQIDRFSM